jgi:hypothetical protein
MSLIQLLFPNEAMVAVSAGVDRWYSNSLNATNSSTIRPVHSCLALAPFWFRLFLPNAISYVGAWERTKRFEGLMIE